MKIFELIFREIHYCHEKAFNRAVMTTGDDLRKLLHYSERNRPCFCSLPLNMLHNCDSTNSCSITLSKRVTRFIVWRAWLSNELANHCNTRWSGCKQKTQNTRNGNKHVKRRKWNVQSENIKIKCWFKSYMLSTVLVQI